MNKHFEKLKPSASIAMMDKARALKAQGVDIISLAGGEPDFDTPHAVTETAIRAIKDGKTHYTTGRGIMPLRERIARKMTEENNIPADAGNILVTPGGKFAIQLAVFSLINPGEEVMILDPSWVSYAPIVQMFGGIPVKVPLSFKDKYKISEDILNEYATDKTKIMIINTPCNPTGRVLTCDEADEIRKFLNKHNDIILISDEVYEKIIFDNHKHISMGSYEDIAKRVITINSFSKSVAMTGWRIGYICAASKLVDLMYLPYQHTLTCISEFSQLAAITALDCTKEMNEMLKSYQRRRSILVDGLNEIPKAQCLMPEGAFYAWLKFDIDGLDSDGISNYLLEKANVVSVSGKSYGLGSKQCVRMCFAASDDDLIGAVQRIKNAME